jgi:hypothetical protein
LFFPPKICFSAWPKKPQVKWRLSVSDVGKRHLELTKMTTTTTTTRPYISSIVYTGRHWWPSTPSAFMDWPWHCKQSIYSGSHWKI